MVWITVGLMKAQPVFLIRNGSKDTIGHFTAVAAIFGLASLSKAATRVSNASAEGLPSPLNLRTAASQAPASGALATESLKAIFSKMLNRLSNPTTSATL